MEPLDTKQIINPKKNFFRGKTGIKYDSLHLGIVLGVISPIIGALGYYTVSFHHMTLKGFYLWSRAADKTSAIISLCLIANLAVFFIFIQTNRNESARGVLMSTFIYAIPVIYFKFFA